MLTKPQTHAKFPYNLVNKNLNSLIRELLQETGPGYQISTSPYDVAWLARLVELDEPVGYAALEWLRTNQLEDGSWGASEPLYYHDRVICTLSAIITLKKYGSNADTARIERALPVFYEYLGKLELDPAGETIAFEMLLPALMAEGKNLGLLPSGGTAELEKMAFIREMKLSKAPGRMINRSLTMAHSTEMVGTDGIRLLDIDNLQEENGSIGYSPAATAFFALHVKRRDRKALEYVRDAANNGFMPYVFPIDGFERGWVLWNLALLDYLEKGISDLCNDHLNFLEDNWLPGEGIASCVGLSFIDADATSLVKEVLTKFGRSVDLTAVLQHEKEEHFRCYDLEANPSISTNIHVLGALRAAGFRPGNSSVEKILRFLQSQKRAEGFWLDKWHASPYYPTAHAIITLSGYSNEMVKNAVEWILNTQNADGSWGYYMPTAEETAYCLQALSIWKQFYGTVPFGVIERGIYWLVNHLDSSYPPLWIGKCLYSPDLVVRSSILTALAMVSLVTTESSKNGVNFRNN